ncbi:conserved hypothetical protein [Vibrio crassostreae]|nr:conserved hypothetical protein [Vibrio crassostreae]CAK2916023.1 conserved hypothetical protein [Vibrio crassostreae]CAK2920789.1 conserved hypothetical protein [Vibrio crassostreae]CAK2934852.1 conserved hypothetical protein [Vibrio crassostreae]CAK2976189.1 conserved hypothetical protein [Vibrio crassostreae]
MERRKSDNRLSTIVIRHINCYVEGTGIAVEKFTRNRVLPELIKAGELTEPEKDAEKWRKSQSRRLVRYIDGENQLSINWVFPFISSLPSEYQQPLKNELCGMLGSFFVALTAMGPRSQHTETRSHLPQMAKEWGDILIQSNPAMDGLFSSDDDPVEVMNYVNEIAECIGILMAELGAVYRATGIEPASVKAYRNSTLFD